MSDYYSILWIDDFDNGSSEYFVFGEMDSEIGGIIEFEEIGCKVNIITDFDDAVEEIRKNYTRFDAVIFDIDMGEGFTSKDELLMSDIGKKLYLENKNISEIEDYAGYYLYLYLMTFGFPPERTCMFTALAENSKNSQNRPKNFGKKFMEAGIKPPKAFSKGYEKGLNKNSLIETKEMKNWILDNYDGENFYYRIRRLVFQACEHWKSELNKENYEISFNKIYYGGEEKIQPQNFIDTLNSIEMMFPVINPEKPEDIYYQAMRMLSNYHEESAKIGILNGQSHKKYHSVIRNFRNWSAHNKFEKKELTDKQFALLFCIALRTYFVDDFNTNEILPYEKVYYGESKGNFVYDENKKKFIEEEEWHSLIEMVNLNFKENSIKKQVPEDLSFDKLLLHIGNQENCKININKLFLGLLDVFESCFEQKNDSTGFTDSYSITFKYKVNSKPKFPEQTFASEHLFLNEAYKIIDKKP